MDKHLEVLAEAGVEAKVEDEAAVAAEVAAEAARDDGDEGVVVRHEARGALPQRAARPHHFFPFNERGSERYRGDLPTGSHARAPQPAARCQPR